jgi:hypothetical protein
MRQISINTMYPDKMGELFDLTRLVHMPTGTAVPLEDGEYVINEVGYQIEKGFFTGSFYPPGAGQLEFDFDMVPADPAERKIRGELSHGSDSNSSIHIHDQCVRFGVPDRAHKAVV